MPGAVCRQHQHALELWRTQRTSSDIRFIVREGIAYGVSIKESGASREEIYDRLMTLSDVDRACWGKSGSSEFAGGIGPGALTNARAPSRAGMLPAVQSLRRSRRVPVLSAAGSGLRRGPPLSGLEAGFGATLSMGKFRVSTRIFTGTL